MSIAQRSRLPSLIAIAGFAALCGATIWLAGPSTGGQAPRVRDDKPASQVFKNIQVLKDIPASQLNLAMDFMSASLGVGCDFCHTADLASDEKSTKATTRQMLVMTANINKQGFSGFNVVNCYTCHRGRTEPASTLEIDESILRPRSDSRAFSPNLPSADILTKKYEAAIGGMGAIDKITTLVASGSQTLYDAGRPPETAGISIYHKAPDKSQSIISMPVGAAFESKPGWVRVGNQLQPSGRELSARAELAADFFEYLKLKQAFPSFRVLGRDRLLNRNVIVAGAVARDAAKVKLYFDAGSGLLLRRAAQIKTPLGVLPDVTDFEDYRKVGGVEMPFRIKRSRPPTMVVERFKTIKINVPIDDSRFSAPPGPDR